MANRGTEKTRAQRMKKSLKGRSKLRREVDKLRMAKAAKKARKPRQVKSNSTRGSTALHKPATRPKFQSIREGIYALFDEKGVGPKDVTAEEAVVRAKSINPKTKFDRWHLYYHRKNYRKAHSLEARTAEGRKQ